MYLYSNSNSTTDPEATNLVRELFVTPYLSTILPSAVFGSVFDILT